MVGLRMTLNMTDMLKITDQKKKAYFDDYSWNKNLFCGTVLERRWDNLAFEIIRRPPRTDRFYSPPSIFLSPTALKKSKTPVYRLGYFETWVTLGWNCPK